MQYKMGCLRECVCPLYCFCMSSFLNWGEILHRTVYGDCSLLCNATRYASTLNNREESTVILGDYLVQACLAPLITLGQGVPE